LVRRGAKAGPGARTLGLDMLRHKCSYITMYNMGYVYIYSITGIYNYVRLHTGIYIVFIYIYG
jgi:hypothetical protein